MYTVQTKKQRKVLAWFLALIMMFSAFAGFNFNVQAAEDDEAKFVEVTKFEDGKEYIFGPMRSSVTEVRAIRPSSSGSGISSDNVAVTSEEGSSAYIITNKTNVIWTYDASNGSLKNGSKYFILNSDGVSNGSSPSSAIAFSDKKISSTTDSTTYYLRYSTSFSSTDDASKATEIHVYEKVESSVKSISLDTTCKTLEIAGKVKLTATVDPVDSAVTWKSDSPSVATVSETGEVTAIAAGTAIITADADGKKATCTIAVEPAGDKTKFEEATELKEGKDFVVAVVGANNKVYAINNNGTSGDAITPVELTVTDAAKDYVETGISSAVWTASKTSSNAETWELKNGGLNFYASMNVTPHVQSYNGNRKLTYKDNHFSYTSTSNNTTTTYYFTYANGKFDVDTDVSKAATFRLFQKVETAPQESISLNPTSKTIYVDEEFTLTATVSPTDSTVSWSVDKPEFVTIDGTGTTVKVKGKSAGTAEITAKVSDDVFATCTVTVKEKITPPPTEGDVYKLVYNFEDGEEYLIVNNNKTDNTVRALKNPGVSSGDVSMDQATVSPYKEGTDQYIKTNATDIVWTATAHTWVKESDATVKDSGYLLTNGDDSLVGYHGNVIIRKSSSDSSKYVWNYTDYQLVNGTSKLAATSGNTGNTYVVYYANDAFTSTHETTDATVYIYQKVSSTPVTKYTVTFNLNGKTGTAPDSQTVKSGGKVNKPQDPVVDGYKLVAWYTDPACSENKKWDFDTSTVTEDITLYAKWEESTTPPPTEGDTYKLVDKLQADHEYLIVNTNEEGSGYAMKNPGANSDGVSPEKASVTINKADTNVDKNYIKTSDTSIVWKTTTNGDGFSLSNDGGSPTISQGNLKIYKPMPEKYQSRSWVYSSSQLNTTYITSDGNGNDTTYTYYIYYSSSSNAFKSSNSSRSVYIYEKVASTPTTDTFTVTFKNDNGDVLLTKNYDKGTTAATVKADAPNATKASTDQYTYEFADWTPTIVDVKADAIYTATYTATTRKYTVKFVNYDDSVLLEAKEYPFGTEADAITKPTTVPTKPSDDEFNYTFGGWEPKIANVTGDAIYKATYTANPVDKTYTITWVNYDDTVLETDKDQKFGDPISYDGATPVRKDDDKYTYTFKAWDPELKKGATVEKDQTYKATFTATEKKSDNPTPTPTPVNPTPGATVDPKVQPTADQIAKAPVNGSLPVIDMDKIKTVASAKKSTMTIGLGKMDADYCQIEYRKAGASAWTSVWVKPSNEVTLKNMKKKSYYQFRFTTFKVVNGQWQKSKTSNTSYRWILNTKVKKVTVKGKTATVTWNKVKGAKGYWVQYSTDKTFVKNAKVVKIKKAKTTSKKIKGLKKGKTYYVRVRPITKKSGKQYLGIYSGYKKFKVKKK